MKIIKRGTPLSEATFIGTCTSCDSIIEGLGSEINFQTVGRAYIIGEKGDMYASCECLVCGDEIEMFKKEQVNK